jgi:hypothetical protein
MYFYMWGVSLVWLQILGGLLYRWYADLIKTNNWWSKQCPPTTWTATTIATDPTVTSTGTATVIEV